MAPALVSGWLLAFTLSLDDVVVASFTSGPGASTLPMVVFSSIKLGATPELYALATVIVAVVAGGPARRVAGAARVCRGNDCPSAAAPIGSAPCFSRESAMHLTAERLDRIQPSLTIAISTKARHMIAEGKNVISLSQGEPDFDTPRNVKDAAIRAIEAGETQIHRRRRHAGAAQGGGGEVQARQRHRLQAGGDHHLHRRQAGDLQRHARAR